MPKSVKTVKLITCTSLDVEPDCYLLLKFFVAQNFINFLFRCPWPVTRGQHHSKLVTR